MREADDVHIVYIYYMQGNRARAVYNYSGTILAGYQPLNCRLTANVVVLLYAVARHNGTMYAHITALDQ